MASKALPRERIEQILDDLRYEPAWRSEASREMDFYDGNQLDTETLRRMEELGMPPIVVNLVAPTIDAVVGLEARTRADPIVRGERDDDTDAAEALNVKLKEATRLSSYNRATADAFKKQACIGMGWVEVSRETDPFKYPYRIREVCRREMWYDWRAREPDLSDARFVVRRRWYDADDLEGHFPRHKLTIRQAVQHRPLWESMTDTDEALALARAWDIETSTSLQEEEWRDTERRRLALYEVWYKVFDSVVVINLPDGRVIEYERDNVQHATAVALGIVTPRKARTHRIRVAYYLGPHQLADEPSPYNHGRFPYVAFFGKREDRTLAPYGLIRAMKSPQEEVNARRTKMLHNLASRRVVVDDDAVLDHRQTAEEVARSDAYIVTNSNRRRDNGLRIDSDDGLNQQQYQLMIEAKGNIQEASGLFHEFMGRGAGAGQSGEAIKSLVEQAQQVLGEIMDNYREGRRQVAELLLNLIVEDLSKQDDIEVPIQRATGERKSVLLNHPETDEFGHKYRTNDVQRMRARVALDETPASITYRQQTMQRMLDITETLPPDLQAAVLDIVISATDLPNRDELVERIRAVTGFGGQPKEPATPEEAAAMQAEMQREAEAQAQQQAMEQRAAELELEEREARVRKMLADAERALALAAKISGADTMRSEAAAMRDVAAVEDAEREQVRRDMHEAADMMERGARMIADDEQARPMQPQPMQPQAPIGP